MNYRKLFWFSVVIYAFTILCGLVLIYQLGGWTYFLYRLQHRGITAEYDHRRSLYEQLPADSATIVLLGNSLTAQGSWSELLGMSEVRNRGIPGDQITGVLARLATVERLKPHTIALMIGVNDLLFRSPEQTLKLYERLMDSIQAQLPEAELLLQSVLPVNNRVRNTRIRNEDIDALNRGIKALAAQRQLHWIDVRPVVSDAQGRLSASFTHDGIHLNGLGYRRWADVLRPYLQKSE